MSPAFQPGDYLLTVVLRRPHRGVAVVFPHPHKQIHLLKRVVALPGDLVELNPNGVQLRSAPTRSTWEVPAGHVVVLSDRLDVTIADSRSFGPVSTDGMRKVLFRYRRARQYR